MNIQDLTIEIIEQLGKVLNITFSKQRHTSTVAILDTLEMAFDGLY